MNYRVSCMLLAGILILSFFGCILGFDNGVNVNNINHLNVSLNGSVGNMSSVTSTIYVDQVRGNDANPGTFENPKKTMKSAVNTVKEGGTVSVAGGVYSGADNTNLNLNKTINITGQNFTSTTIDGQNNQIYRIAAGKTVFISGLTFLNGKSDQGGAINNLGNLNINNCVFKNNEGSTGGAVYNKNNLYIANSNFTSNHVNANGGAIYTRQGKCTVVSSVFGGNGATGDGGAINNNREGNLQLVNCQFHDNTAKTAGALSNFQNCGIKSCTFNQNTADRMGGAIYSMGNLNVDASQFKGNNAMNDIGGAIGTGQVDSGSFINITNTKFEYNHAKNYGAVNNVATMSIKQSMFNKNHADENGGALGSSGNLDVLNSNFTSNTADKYGGAVICFNGGASNLKNSNYTNNTGFEIGGAVVALGYVDLDGNNFKENNSTMGGAVYNEFSGDTNHLSSKIDNNNFIKNTAQNFGGAVINLGMGTLSNNNFTWNKVMIDAGMGGAISNHQGTLRLENNNFKINFVCTEKSTGDPDGGGIANLNSSHIYISGSNTHFMDSNIYNEAFLDVSDCTIEKNCDDGRYLNNDNAKDHKESNIQITSSGHYYEKPCSKVQIDVPSKVDVKKGDSTEVTAQLWRQYDAGFLALIIPFIHDDINVPYASEAVLFSIYNDNGYMELFNYDGELCRGIWDWTNIAGKASRTISTDKLNPGDYRLQIYTDGKKGVGIGDCPCIRTIDLTVLP